MMGNRGVLHDADKHLVRPWQVKRWICCLTKFRGRRRPELMAPGCYTELFFLDEAVALAAGHRPCFECRRKQARDFAAAWCPAMPPKAGEMDHVLHDERIYRETRQQRRHGGRLEDLPDGAFVLLDDSAWLVQGNGILRYTAAGYDVAEPRPHGGRATVLTPPSVLTTLERSYTPCLHPSAAALSRTISRCGSSSE